MLKIKSLIPNSVRYFLNSWRTCWFLARNNYSNFASQPDVLDLKQLEIHPITQSPDKFYINPTLGIRNSYLEIFYRETNISIRPEADKKGVMKKVQIGDELSNTVFKGILTNDGKISQAQEVVENRKGYSLEDVRVAYWLGHQVLIGAQVNQSQIRDEAEWRTRVAINLNGVSTPLPSPVGKRFEKNWVPINVVNNQLHLLHSNKPTRVISVNLVNLTQESWVTENSQSGITLSGGSQFVLLRDFSYFRVARKRFPLFDRGYVHISFIVAHDFEFRESAISTPFIFRDFGFEICNGLVLDESDKFYFSWGENDLRMYLGICTYSSLLSWFEHNRMNKRKKRGLISSILKMFSIRSSL